jgi:hypothetical protein
MRALFLFLFTFPALAGDFIGGVPGSSLGVRSDVAALASNRQNFNFGSGGTEYAPTPGSNFAPSSECQGYLMQSTSFLVGSESTSTPVTLYHCIQEHFANIMGGLAVGFHNIGHPEEAYQTMLIARDTLVAGNRDGHRTAKALGVPISSRPDEGDATRFLFGGPILYHVLADSTPGAAPKQPYVPKSDYQPPNPNPALDQGFQEQMRK